LYSIFDNLLTQQQTEEIKNFLLSSDFPWFMQNKTVKNNTEFDANEFQEITWFSHSFYRNSDVCSGYFNIPNTILNSLPEELKNNRIIHRCHASLTLNNGTTKPQPPHVDDTKDHTVVLYYVNDSDGDTLLYDLETTYSIQPKAGRVVVFDGSLLHSGNVPSNFNSRIIINFNLIYA